MPATVLHGDGWTVAARPPHPALAGAVRRLIGFAETTPASVRRLELPTSGVAVIIGFAGDGWEVQLPWSSAPDRRDRHVAFAAGLHGAAAITEQRGAVAGVQLDLTPAGARRLLGLSMAELAGRVAPLADALPAWADLPARLAAAPGWDARLRLVERAVCDHLAPAPAPARVVERAVARLHATGGGVSIGALCEEVGWSRRHLATRFREEVGVTPKAFARLVRFERAAGALAAGGGVELARLAAECGYSDQPHFTREFRAFAGLTPTAYLAHRADPAAGLTGAAIAEVTSVQDPARAAA